MRWLLLCLVVVGVGGRPAAEPSHETEFPRALYCYYTPADEVSGVPRDARLAPSRVPPHCTHVVYGFAGITSRHEIAARSEGDLPSFTEPGTYARLNAFAAGDLLMLGGEDGKCRLKRKNPDMRVMLAVRPDARQGHHSAPRADLEHLQPSHAFLTNPYTRWTFATSTLRLLRQHKLDGVVLHVPKAERHKWQYMQMLKDMRALFDGEELVKGQRRLVLTVFVGAKHLEKCKAFLPDVANLVDHIFLATWINGAETNSFQTSFVNPLTASDRVASQHTIRYFVHFESDAAQFAVLNGVPKSKLIVGLSIWARSYKLKSSELDRVSNPAAGWGSEGFLSRRPGFLSYPEVCELKETMNVVSHLDQDTQSSYIVNRGMTEWVSYTGRRTLKPKVEWIKSQAFGGVGVWGLDAEDHRDVCGLGPFPLLSVVRDVLPTAPINRPAIDDPSAGPRYRVSDVDADEDGEDRPDLGLEIKDSEEKDGDKSAENQDMETTPGSNREEKEVTVPEEDKPCEGDECLAKTSAVDEVIVEVKEEDKSEQKEDKSGEEVDAGKDAPEEPKEESKSMSSAEEMEGETKVPDETDPVEHKSTAELIDIVMQNTKDANPDPMEPEAGEDSAQVDNINSAEVAVETQTDAKTSQQMEVGTNQESGSVTGQDTEQMEAENSQESGSVTGQDTEQMETKNSPKIATETSEETEPVVIPAEAEYVPPIAAVSADKSAEVVAEVSSETVVENSAEKSPEVQLELSPTQLETQTQEEEHVPEVDPARMEEVLAKRRMEEEEEGKRTATGDEAMEPIVGQLRAGERPPVSRGSCVRMCHYRPDHDKSNFDFRALKSAWCTHVVLAFTLPRTDGSLLLSPEMSLAHSLFQKWSPKDGGPKPSLIFAIKGVPRITTSAVRRLRLLDTIDILLNISSADGIDLHWGEEALQTSYDSRGFATFVKELRARLNGQKRFLQLIVSVYPKTSFRNLYQVGEISKNADYINIIGHMFHNVDEYHTGHHAALFYPRGETLGDPRMTLYGLTKYWLDGGVPRAKLVAGLTSEAQSQALIFSPEVPDFGLPADGPGKALNRTRTPGVASYDELMELLGESGSEYRWMGRWGVPIASFGKQFYAFDNLDSVWLKTLWAHGNRMGGVSIHALELNNPWGLGSAAERRFPFPAKAHHLHSCLGCAPLLPNHHLDCNGELDTPLNFAEMMRGGKRRAQTAEQRLLYHLLRSYEKSTRPTENASTIVVVRLGLTLISIFDMDEKNQVLTTNVWLDQEWVDELLRWNPADFGGIESIRIPCDLIWLPDLVLYNNADDYTSRYMRSRAMIYHTGTVFWPPPAQLRSTCKGLEVDLRNRSDGIDLSNYVINGEFDLVETIQKRRVVKYSCCKEPYPDIIYVIFIRRKLLFYMINVVLPCSLMSALTLLVFRLPPNSGEKIALGITVLLAFSVFTLAVAEKMPETSESYPLIGIYLTTVITISSISVVMTVVVLNLHYRGPFTHPVPRPLSRAVLGFLRPLLCMPKPHVPPHFRRRKEEEAILNNAKRIVIVKDKSMEEDMSLLHGGLELEEMDGLVFENRLNEATGPSAPVDAYRPMGASARDGLLAAKIQSLQKNLFQLMHRLSDRQNFDDRLEEQNYEWRMVAEVIDRLFFWIFFVLTAVLTLFLLIVVPIHRRGQDLGGANDLFDSI